MISDTAGRMAFLAESSHKIYDIRVLQKCESWYNSYRRMT